MPIQKTIRVKIFDLENKKFQLVVKKAPPNKQFTDDGINNFLTQTANYLEKTFPNAEYRLVELGRNQFNFICEKVLVIQST